MSSVGDDEIISILSLPLKMTSGDDALPSFLLRDCKYALAGPSKSIHNKPINCSNCFPDRWKTAKIIAVHKKGEKIQIRNYRPISLLNKFSKIFERIIFRKIFFVDVLL